MASDAFIVGEDWISEHYFTTDAKSQSFGSRVLARRKEWDELASPSDGAAALPTPRSRFTAATSQLSAAFAAVGPAADAQTVRDGLIEPLRRVLGFTSGNGRDVTSAGPLSLVSPSGIDGAPAVALIEAHPVDALEDLLIKDAPSLLEPFVPADDAGHPVTSVARLLSRLFIADGGPAFAVVLAGRWALIAERDRWPEGRYLAIDLQLVADRGETGRAGEVDRALACLSADSFVPDAEGTVWWSTVLDDAVKHTVGVSKDLRDGVRLSIEIIGNDVVTRRRLRGLDPLPADEAQPLAKQALRYLYRILFLLYAEASPELQVLPVNASEYDEGYSLDRLRELVLVPLTHDAEQGTHLYQSLGVLFRMVDEGAPAPLSVDGVDAEGLEFHSLRADLFDPQRTALIGEVGLSDAALQRVLAYLLLTKQEGKRDRGFISYADLGINQLGAVYEGLMSYTGFFAETELLELAKDGDASKGSWVVPVERADDPVFAPHFVQVQDPITGERRAVRHAEGSFVFRLAGRERQQSASFYTPEVLTRFVVSQALAELLDQNDTVTPARDILDLTICEPALGSGAFAIEAVRQLADQYLARRQAETGQTIDPDDYARELQKVKASIALHQVYGVDLNATAVELAEISLWLDTMVAGLDAPWFGLHLRRGNSLIGARRAVFTRAQVESKGWLSDVPRDVPVTSLAEDLADGRIGGGMSGSIHHFLLPSSGWGSAADAKEAKELAPEAQKSLKAWRRSVAAKPSKSQLDRLVALSSRVEKLWQLALRRRQVAEQEIRRDVDVWGADDLPAAGKVQRAEIEEKLDDANGAYLRLRRVMDAWNALWFWPLTRDDIAPPNLEKWICALEAILGRHRDDNKRGAAYGNVDLSPGLSWSDLATTEEYDLSIAGAQNIQDVLKEHPWLEVADTVASRQGFFHWELDFATVFARGGFDLQVGNPPWVRPRMDVDSVLAEVDPWWNFKARVTTAIRAARFDSVMRDTSARLMLIDSAASTSATSAALSSAVFFPHLAGLQPDLYRCFMDACWLRCSPSGIVALIHPETHFTDEKAGLLRRETYLRLRRHWQFINSLLLFEIKDNKRYGVHVYGSAATRPAFLQATSIYHPSTVEGSLRHDGNGPEPGLRDGDGKWDLRPHRARILGIGPDELAAWAKVFDEADAGSTRMVFTPTDTMQSALGKLFSKDRMAEAEFYFSAGWVEGQDDRVDGAIDISWGRREESLDVVLQGTFFHVMRPFYKHPNASMLNNQDTSVYDLENLRGDGIPITAHVRSLPRAQYTRRFGLWGSAAVLEQYRVAWRAMADNVGQRTLAPAIIPPGFAHVDGVYAMGAGRSPRLLPVAAGFLASLITDFVVRAAPKSTIRGNVVERLPFVANPRLGAELSLRVLVLNCLTQDYAALWGALWDPAFTADSWSSPTMLSALARSQRSWDMDVPIRVDRERRQALIEIDAIVALELGMSIDELVGIYSSQFPVLVSEERRSMHDANGRLVPNSVLTVWRKKGDSITEDERTATNASGNTYTYALPFVTLDREADMRQAYAHFEKVLDERA